MSNPNSSLPAFPIQTDEPFHKGLTKREQLAALNFAALIGSSMDASTIAAVARMADAAIYAADILLERLAKLEP